MKLKIIVGIVAVAVLLSGFGVIIYEGRPVMHVETPSQTTHESSSQTVPTNNKPTASDPSGYSMSDVAKHDSINSCWSSINGSVYDLTSWISRHPGGPDPIITLCGADGSAAFNMQHGRSRSAQSMLALLKIGTLN